MLLAADLAPRPREQGQARRDDDDDRGCGRDPHHGRAGATAGPPGAAALARDRELGKHRVEHPIGQRGRAVLQPIADDSLARIA